MNAHDTKLGDKLGVRALGTGVQVGGGNGGSGGGGGGTSFGGWEGTLDQGKCHTSVRAVGGCEGTGRNGNEHFHPKPTPIFFLGWKGAP